MRGVFSKNILRGAFFFFALGIFFVTEGEESLFLRDLKHGDSGVEVEVLQKALNKNLETQIAVVGPGSPGNETTFFGSLTLQAVIKFQNLYKKEVLEPVGLPFGTGFVGIQTRKQLKTLFPSIVSLEESTSFVASPSPSNKAILESQPTILIPGASPAFGGTSQQVGGPALSDLVSSVGDEASLGPDSELIFFYPSHYAGKAGTLITLHGSGFSLSDNTVFFGDRTFVNIASEAGKTITFRVPQGSSGRYEVAISNKGKRSNSHYFHVTLESAGAPLIEKITPPTPRNGDKITILGKGFTSSNVVFTGFSVVEGLPSLDGNTLSLVLDSPFGVSGGEEGVPTSIPLWFYVENENGFSNEYVLNLDVQ